MSWLAEAKFSMGSSVTLKSGGLAMTVVSIDGDNATCVWLDKTGRDRSRDLPMCCLMHDGGGAFNLIIEGFNATAEEVDQLTGRKAIGNA